jgi:uncharacterized protein
MDHNHHQRREHEVDLNATLAKVESAGGKVVVPKMPLGDMSPGYVAQFIDSEGNRLGLWSAE